MIELNLKKYYPKVKSNKSILCGVRKRLIFCTPEESIRQAFISFLVKEKGYPLTNIDIEVPMSRFKEGASGRADILIYDDFENVLCLIECKEPREIINEAIFAQVERYDNIVQAETCCILIGHECHFLFFPEGSDVAVKASEFPTYKTLLENGQMEYFIPEARKFEKISICEPLDKDVIEDFYDDGVFGEDTKQEFLPFLINLYNFYNDVSEKIIVKNAEDVGLKTIKYGNAGSGTFAGIYRSFLVKDECLVSFAISSMTRGENFPINTSLLFGVDNLGKYHLSLELSVERNVLLERESAIITHDGKITVGKLGPSKRIELINFINDRHPELIKNGKVFLGKLNWREDINGNQKETISFVENCIVYALLRDEFRAFKKEIKKKGFS